MMNNPLVTILIANHNYGKYIESCIKSAQNQTYQNIKIIVVDDASTDNSREIIDKLADKDFRITTKCLSTCVGASEARNIAIRQCLNETDYFLILDADDEARTTKVAEMLQVIQTSNAIGCVYGDYDILNVETGNIIREFKEPYSLKRLQQDCIVHSASLISKEALETTKELYEFGNISFYDKRLHGPANQTFQGCCEDFDLWLRIAERFIIVHIPKSLSLVRVHPHNASKIEKVQPVWQTNWSLMQQKVTQRRNANNSNKTNQE